jgi:hypothetical protein
LNRSIRIILAGLLGGFVSEGILGILFANSLTKSILYDPRFQSRLYIDITAQRNLPISIAGLVILSLVHAWLFVIFLKSVPGDTWVKKGLFWGFTIWLLYWVFQEWFMFRMLLGEPIILNLLELALLLIGSLIEGLIIAAFFRTDLAAREQTRTQSSRNATR